jgi:ribose transport system permease protein
MRRLVARYGIVIVFLGLVVVLSFLQPTAFPTYANAGNILSQASVPIIMALVLTLPMVMGDFDLSFGAVASLAGAVAILLMTSTSVGMVPAVLGALATGLLLGIINGFLVGYAGVSAFIITLAMSSILAGIELALTQGAVIYQGGSQGIDPAYLLLSRGRLLGFQYSVWFTVGVAVVLWVIMKHTPLGRYMHAIGGNREAAFLSGINVAAVRLVGFAIVGIGSAFAGVLLMSQAASYYPGSTSGLLLPTYAGLFIGASTLSQGRFHVWGSFFGVVFMGTVQTGLTMLNQPSWTSNLIQGILLAVAVLVTRVEAGKLDVKRLRSVLRLRRIAPTQMSLITPPADSAEAPLDVGIAKSLGNK